MGCAAGFHDSQGPSGHNYTLLGVVTVVTVTPAASVATTPVDAHPS